MSGQRWEVVGGVEAGGIVVRAGRGLSSEQLSDRLATGAVVREVELADDRLLYERLSGGGPDRGWVSVGVKGKALVVRQAEEVPPASPVLVCFYSGGMTAAQGRAQLRGLLAAAAAAGLADQLVLDHASEEAYAGCGDWDGYVARLAEQVSGPGQEGRGVLIFAHSHGCLEAYGLARRLGPRLLKLYVVARRPPSLPLLDEVWGVNSGAEVARLSDAQLLEGLLGAWRNEFLAGYLGKAVLPPMVQKVLATVRAQYSSPCAPGGSAELHAVVGSGGPEASVLAPVLAVACSKELPKGETAAKMEGWRDLAGAGFELRVVDADHMDCLQVGPSAAASLVELLVADMRQFLAP